MQYVSTYSRLNEALQSAKRLLSAGDFGNARLQLDSARELGAILHRRQKFFGKLEAAARDLQFSYDKSIQCHQTKIIESVNDSWQDIAAWLDNVIRSVGKEELLRSADGINILLDRTLGSTWDFNHDIVVLTGANAQEFIRPLTYRGQLRIVVVSEQIAGNRGGIEQVAVEQRGHLSPTLDATIVTIGGALPLTDDQVSALSNFSLVSPNYLHVSTGPADQSSTTFEKIVGQMGKEFILQESQCVWPITFVENFVNNLSKISCLQSVSDLKPLVAGSNIMIVSPGPSLLDSLPKILEFRQDFVVVSLVRSLPILLDYGIIPDFAIIVDAADHNADHLKLLPNDSRFSDISMIVSEYIHPTTLEASFNEFFLMPTAELTGSPLSIALHGRDPPLCVGTSVASFAVSMFAELEVATITLVGQDLSIARATYADSHQAATRRHYGELTCLGINGEQLLTQDDYLQFKSELEYLASKYGHQIKMFNCTTFGAFLDNWKHLQLNSAHPVVVEHSKIRLFDEGDKSAARPRNSIADRDIGSAIDLEVTSLLLTQQLIDSVTGEIQSFFSGGSEDLAHLESAETDLLTHMNSSGALAKFYTLPTKLTTQAALRSVRSLEENLAISLEYYLMMVVQIQRIVQLLELSGVTSPREVQ